MIEARLWGDPFADSLDARNLRALLAAAHAAGVRCGLSLTATRLRPSPGPSPGRGREVVLSDGCGGDLRVLTVATDAELRLVLAASECAVVATAPLVVFGTRADVAQAGFEFVDACAVLHAVEGAATLLPRLQEVIAQHGEDATPCELDAGALAAAGDEPAAAHRVLVLAGSGDAQSVGPVFAALATLQRERPLQMAIATSAAEAARVRGAMSAAGLVADLHVDADERDLLHAAAVVVLPWRATGERTQLARALASGRAVVAPRTAADAELLADGGCFPVGGCWQPTEQGRVFVPDARHLLAQLRRAVGEPASARHVGRRGRRHALTHARGPRPGRPQPVTCAFQDRPSLVLEAPLFELSSSSLLTFATARALIRRDQVEVFVVPRGAHQVSLTRLAEQAPEVLARCVRQPPAATDLWLTTGWPPRASRPSGAHTFAVRVDWEYGALPLSLSPLVVQEADAVVVHSRAVEATIVASGRARDSIALVPHGVDGEVFQPFATPLAEVVAFKRERAASCLPVA